MKTIKLIEQSGYMYIASYGETYEVSDEDYSKITSPEYKTTLTDGIFSFKIDEDIIAAEKKSEITNIEKQMKAMNSDRKDLQDLIDLGLNAPGDVEAVEVITNQLGALASQRISLKS